MATATTRKPAPPTLTTSFMTAIAVVTNPLEVAVMAAPAIEATLGSMWDSAKHDARRAVEVTTQGVATMEQPAVNAISNVAGAMKGIADDVKDVAKKALIGEVIAAGMVLVGIGAAIYFSKGSGKKASDE